MDANSYVSRKQKKNNAIYTLSTGGVILAVGLVLSCAMLQTVPTGNEAVGTRFGQITGEVLTEGIHVVNPLNDWDLFSTMQQSTLLDDTSVPAADQQKVDIDISIQWRIKPGMAKALRAGTGNEQAVFDVQFLPNARAALRDAGRSVERVEDFYSETTVQKYRDEALAVLRQRLDPVGIEVQDILVRDVTLPQMIADAITAKKQREQEVEKERAELERVRLQMQQQVAKSEADAKAAELDAQAKKIRADAEAFSIEKVREQVTPTYIDYMNALKWDGSYPQVMTGQDAVPLLQVNVPSKGRK